MEVNRFREIVAGPGISVEASAEGRRRCASWASARLGSSFPLVQRGEQASSRMFPRLPSSYTPQHVGHATELSAGHREYCREEERQSYQAKEKLREYEEAPGQSRTPGTTVKHQAGRHERQYVDEDGRLGPSTPGARKCDYNEIGEVPPRHHGPYEISDRGYAGANPILIAA